MSGEFLDELDLCLAFQRWRSVSRIPKCFRATLLEALLVSKREADVLVSYKAYSHFISSSRRLPAFPPLDHHLK